jgi:hypothetical protein
MLASIIYNYGKFFADFKSTLKLGAYEKHNKNAKFGWYRYDVRFALPVYEENTLVRYNIFHARILINHAENGRKYLYDILAIKKETSKP